MKLNQIINPLIDVGIFQKIFSKNELDYLSEDECKTLDINYYLGHSGNKTISPLYDNLLKLHQNDGVDVLSILADIIILHNAENWNKIYESYFLSSYNPLENYSMSETENYNINETETPNITKESNQKQKTKIITTNNNEQNSDVYGFNSTSPSPSGLLNGVAKQEVIGSDDDNKVLITDTERGTRNKTSNNTKNLTRSGNIGVTTSQEMLESELKLRKFDFYNLLMRDVDKTLCLKIYI